MKYNMMTVAEKRADLVNRVKHDIGAYAALKEPIAYKEDITGISHAWDSIETQCAVIGQEDYINEDIIYEKKYNHRRVFNYSRGIHRNNICIIVMVE